MLSSNSLESRAHVSPWPLQLLLFDSGSASSPPISSVSMGPSAHGEGVWEAKGKWSGMYYNYDIQVFCPWTLGIERSISTDPYSVSLSPNGLRSHICDIARSAALQPDGWDQVHTTRRPLSSVMDTVIYELHIRDFSASDRSVPERQRGTYRAFTVDDSGGVREERRWLGCFFFSRRGEKSLTWIAVLICLLFS